MLNRSKRNSATKNSHRDAFESRRDPSHQPVVERSDTTGSKGEMDSCILQGCQRLPIHYSKKRRSYSTSACFNKCINSLLESCRRWCSACRAIYPFTADRAGGLTENAAYPSCQAK